MANFCIFTLIILAIVFMSPCKADLDDPPTLMLNEILSMSRHTRIPKIIFDMVKKCEQIEADKQKQIVQEWQKCITGFYAKPLPTNLERITSDCNSFSKTNQCYKPMITTANSCYGENSNLFEFTTSLLNYVCENKEQTAEVIQGDTQKFSGLNEGTTSGMDACLAKKYHDEPHRRNETCKGLDIVDFCVDKYLLKNPGGSLPQNLVNFFSYMMTHLKSQLKCDKNFNEIITTSTEKPIEEKSDSPATNKPSTGISLILHQQMNPLAIYSLFYLLALY